MGNGIRNPVRKLSSHPLLTDFEDTTKKVLT